jgi:hypothetical protein
MAAVFEWRHGARSTEFQIPFFLQNLLRSLASCDPSLFLCRIAAYYSLASHQSALVLSFILHIFLLDTPRRLSLSSDRSIKRNSVIPAQRIMSSITMRDHTDAAPLDFLDYFQRSQPVPTDQLVERIRDRDWEGARQRAVTHPWDARYQTESNSTALHLVCVYRAPCNVVQMVLDAFSQCHHGDDGEGWTPLMWPFSMAPTNKLVCC